MKKRVVVMAAIVFSSYLLAITGDNADYIQSKDEFENIINQPGFLGIGYHIGNNNRDLRIFLYNQLQTAKQSNVAINVDNQRFVPNFNAKHKVDLNQIASQEIIKQLKSDQYINEYFNALEKYYIDGDKSKDPKNVLEKARNEQTSIKNFIVFDFLQASNVASDSVNLKKVEYDPDTLQPYPTKDFLKDEKERFLTTYLYNTLQEYAKKNNLQNTQKAIATEGFDKNKLERDHKDLTSMINDDIFNLLKSQSNNLKDQFNINVYLNALYQLINNQKKEDVLNDLVILSNVDYAPLASAKFSNLFTYLVDEIAKLGQNDASYQKTKDLLKSHMDLQKRLTTKEDKQKDEEDKKKKEEDKKKQELLLKQQEEERQKQEIKKNLEAQINKKIEDQKKKEQEQKSLIRITNLGQALYEIIAR